MKKILTIALIASALATSAYAKDTGFSTSFPNTRTANDMSNMAPAAGGHEAKPAEEKAAPKKAHAKKHNAKKESKPADAK